MPSLKLVEGLPTKKAQQRPADPISDLVIELLAQMSTITPADAAAMSQAQSLLSQLTGEPCTNVLVYLLQLLLGLWNWRVRCPRSGCGKSAGIEWVRIQEDQFQGAIRVFHPEKGHKRFVHFSSAKMPNLELTHSLFPASRTSKRKSEPLCRKRVMVTLAAMSNEFPQF